MLVVIDTNIFINGVFFPKKHEYCNLILDYIEEEKITPVFSQETIGELMYVFKNFAIHSNLPEKVQKQYVHSISELFYDSKSVNTQYTKCPEINDQNDKMFLKIAYQQQVDYIITHDKKSGLFNQFNHKRKYKTIIPSEFINIIKLNP